MSRFKFTISNSRQNSRHNSIYTFIYYVTQKLLKNQNIYILYILKYTYVHQNTQYMYKIKNKIQFLNLAQIISYSRNL